MNDRNAPDELARNIRFRPSYDYRDEPDDQRGCGSVIITFVLRGTLGAISTDILTGWMSRPYLGTAWPITVKGPLTPRDTKPGADLLTGHKGLRSGGVFSHCAEQRRDWWYGPDECSILGVPCYGDKGYLVGDGFLDELVTGGDEAGWKWMRECYDEWLGPERTEDGA
jgi:hypothetical protein